MENEKLKEPKEVKIVRGPDKILARGVKGPTLLEPSYIIYVKKDEKWQRLGIKEGYDEEYEKKLSEEDKK